MNTGSGQHLSARIKSNDTTEGFLRHGSDTYIANFAETEREVLVNLVQQIIEILAERHYHAN